MPILVFHSPIFIYILLAWKWPDKAINVALRFLLRYVAVPTANILFGLWEHCGDLGE